MEDGYAAFERLNTEAELRSVFVVEPPGSSPLNCHQCGCSIMNYALRLKVDCFVLFLTG